MQAKLLRVLQGGALERLGSNQTRRVDVRVVSATHRDLPAMVEAGEFRQDLFYRLNVVPIHVPPLRERIQDIRPIVQDLMESHNRRLGRHVRLSEEALRRLEAHDWPGNVRELNNVLERAVLLSTSPLLTDIDLPARTGVEEDAGRPGTGTSSKLSTLKEAVERAERKAILEALERTGDNKTRAADLLGVSVRTLWYKIRGLGLTPPDREKEE
jgi:transcriptional regulator with PAS, ATPase and Fis domain